MNIDNQDAGIPHNFDLLTEEGGEEIGKTAVEPGPIQQTLDVDALDAGEYFYVCDVHPTHDRHLAASRRSTAGVAGAATSPRSPGVSGGTTTMTG